MELIKLDDLDAWITGKFNDDSMIKIRGGFRRSKSLADPTIPLFEIRGANAYTVRVQIPLKAPLSTHKGTKIASDCFANADDKWWDVWAAVMSSSALLAPLIDPITLASVLNDKRHLRLCCDTNALCNGSVSWLLHATDGNATILTSAVVDREIAAWADNGREKFWNPKEMYWFVRRTHYRLARRSIERPAIGIVVDRISPEQSALMLAKLRDEDKTMAKSPDADMLLIELARSVVREQPRNARVLYVTGDRNNARAAVGALGAQNVLFAVVDGKSARSLQGKVVSRGWWKPHGPLGSTAVPPLANLLWNTMAACDFVSVSDGSATWRIKPHVNFDIGTPSDWETPWLAIDRYPDLQSQESVEDPSESDSDQAGLPKELSAQEVPESPATTGNDEDDGSQTPPPDPNLSEVNPEERGLTAGDIWLLAPRPSLSGVIAPEGWRTTPKLIFELLSSALLGIQTGDSLDKENELVSEAMLVLSKLEAIDMSGEPGPAADRFKAAWLANDLEWYHNEFLRLPGYQSTLKMIRSDPGGVLSARRQTHARLARTLGQAAVAGRRKKIIEVGDSPVSRDMLVASLSIWLPSRNATIAISDLCSNAMRELGLTPARLELAMMQLWQHEPNAPFEARTGGTVASGAEEKVIALAPQGYAFRDVSTSALSFGQDGFARFITRTSDE